VGVGTRPLTLFAPKRPPGKGNNGLTTVPIHGNQGEVWNLFPETQFPETQAVGPRFVSVSVSGQGVP